MDMKDKVRALLAKTVANGCTPEESAAARSMAETLCTKYGLKIVTVSEAPAAKPSSGFNPWKVNAWQAYCAARASGAHTHTHQHQTYQHPFDIFCKCARCSQIREAARQARANERAGRTGETYQERKARKRSEAAKKAWATRRRRGF